MTYILKVSPELIEKFVEESDTQTAVDEEGCAEAFDANFEVNDKVIHGLFLDEVFVYINSKNKINYSIEDKTFSITTLNSNYALLGYLSSTNQIFLMNKAFQLIAYNFPLSFVTYQMAILKKEFQTAEKVRLYIN